jgi:hypothetical protein
MLAEHLFENTQVNATRREDISAVSAEVPADLELAADSAPDGLRLDPVA